MVVQMHKLAVLSFVVTSVTEADVKVLAAVGLVELNDPTKSDGDDGIDLKGWYLV